VDETDTAWGSTEAETVDELNNLFVNAGGTAGVAPVYTAPTTINVQSGDAINYFAEATGGVTFEWENLPTGLSIANNNERNLLGALPQGTYNLDVISVNYYGSTTTTLTIEVAAPAYQNTKSTFLQNQDYLEGSATTANPLYRASNGSLDAWTISFWYKPSTQNKTMCVLYYGGDDKSDDASVRVYFRGQDDHLRLFYGSKHNYVQLDTPDDSLSPNAWHHCLVTFDGGTTGVASGSVNDYYSRFNLYIDGVLQSTTNSHSNFGNNDEVEDEDFFIGRSAGSPREYNRNVYLDELALWSSDQTANAATIYNAGVSQDLSLLASPPVHYWRMGDGNTHPTISDEIGSLDLTMVNMSVSNFVNDAP